MKTAPTDNQEKIITKDELLLGDWTPVRNEVWASANLSDGAFRCYVAICSHVWKGQDTKAWPGQQRLATLLGVSRRTIISYLRELEEVGLLKTERRGLNKTNLYYLLKPKTGTLSPRQYTEVKKSSHQEVKKFAHQEVKPASHKEQEVEEQTMNHHDDCGKKQNSNHTGDAFYLAIDEKLADLGIRTSPSAVDSEAMVKLKQAGVDIDLVLSTMDEVTENNRASPNSKKIRSFGYFVPAILEAHEAKDKVAKKALSERERMKKRLEEIKKEIDYDNDS